MNESYTQIFNHGLLRKIIAHLPGRDQLNVRKVNKDWEREAGFALGQNSRLKILFNGPYELIDFLLTFYAPPSGPNRLFPLVNTVIAPVCIPTDRIEIFLHQHAEYVRTLTIIANSRLMYPAAEKAKIILILNGCPNVELLKFKIGVGISYDGRICRGDPDVPTVGPLTQLSKVRHIDINCAVAQIGIVHQILENAPVLSSFSLSLHESDTLHPLTYIFFNKLKLLGMSPKMALHLYLSDQPGQNSLIHELIRSEFKPKDLVVKIEPTYDWQHDNTTECGRNLLRDLLIQMCGNGVEKLKFRAELEHDIRIYLPDEMPWLKSLTFDRHRRCIIPNMKLTSGQVPNLETLVTYTEAMILAEGDCYPKMRKLVIQAKSSLFSRVEPMPSSVTWPTQFPNLTTLDIFLNAGEREGTLLQPILTRMLNLFDLTLVFKDKGRGAPTAQIWDTITGIMRPILDKNSPLDKIIPPEVEPPTQEHGLDTREPDLPTVPALYNLRKLKFLKLEHVPICIVVAIVHLTATHKLPRLSKLYLSHSYERDFEPVLEWAEVLRREHNNVTVDFD